MATDSPQRRWQAACPNCGAPVEFASAASASAVCSFCKSTLVREGEALRKIGESAELIEDYSPLQLGASGRYQGAPFTLVGRIQYGYAEGSWNEWHALFDSGRSGWLSEDNGSFVFAFEAPLGDEAPRETSLEVGGRLMLAGQAWTLAALTLAQVAAAQGELPHPPAPSGQQFQIAELRSSQDEVGSLDYSDPAAPQWSIGRAVRITDLAMSGLREGESSATLGSRALPCPNCGAALEPKLGSTVSLSCPQCRSVVDISKGVGADLAHFEQGHSGEPQIPLGRTGQLAFPGSGNTLPWQVVGYQERCDIPESSEDETTFWREYLLFNKTEGFIFLVDTEEGWSLVRPLTGAPAGSGNSVNWKGKSFRRQYAYTAKTTYVLGEFYWQVQRDERALVIDYQGPGGEVLSREQTGKEITWSHGAKIDAAVVQRAFKLGADMTQALRRDTNALGEGGGGLTAKIVVAIFIIAILFAMLSTCSRRSDDCQVYKDSYGESSAEYQQCRRNSSGSGVRSSGGSYGGFSSGGGGHK